MAKEPKFIGKAKISRQGQVTLPFEARKDLGISLHSDVYWYEVNDCLIVCKELVNQKEVLDLVLKKKLRNKK